MGGYQIIVHYTLSLFGFVIVFPLGMTICRGFTTTLTHLTGFQRFNLTPSTTTTVSSLCTIDTLW